VGSEGVEEGYSVVVVVLVTAERKLGYGGLGGEEVGEGGFAGHGCSEVS